MAGNHASHRPFRLGVTGGIGSGKSTVASLLGACGFPVLDADAVSRSLTQAGGAAIAPIAHAFGPTLLTPQGALDRPAMRRLIVTNPEARARLEAILHPMIERELRSLERAATAKTVVLDVPLLLESAHWSMDIDHLIVVDCSVSTQIERVRQRSGLSDEEVHALLAIQTDRATRLAHADSILLNDGCTIEALRQDVEALVYRLGLSSPRTACTVPLAPQA
ncbi:dephospho-CoA kinase [Candidatus Symbiobacter mobilis]|uniref:Dephospho-CoA kinase n=1 Tax=Candidatus Symbiobacter mobilis CR TaxID=946483 RepID=U5NAD0_9BURK|nr:dephospho-CoA kinase [Candidatus Symbiobacter mobilis]AGX87154.1 dephospho-CoA kinase [Candidatus Symbiobacter mobilis CR]